MKGLNIKRIVALGIGAALVGSALAPVISAEAYNNLDTLVKSDVVSSAGVPVVDVVVGGSAAISDVVWAGNIAARVAQLATTSAGAAGDATVDVTVGGVQTTTGSGETAEATADFTDSTGEAGLAAITVTSTQMPSLLNNPSTKVKWNSTSYSTENVSEELSATIDVDFQGTKSSTKYAVGELVGSVAKGAIDYTIDVPDINIELDVTGMDASSSYDVKVPLFGETYVLDEIDASESRIVLYADTTPTELAVGESVEVAGVGDYAGKTLTVQLLDLVQTGNSTAVFQAKWVVKDGDTALKYVQQVAGTDLKDEFGNEYFTDSVTVTAAGMNVAAGTYTATIRTGSSRIEIRDGYGFPYTANTTTDSQAQWQAAFTKTGNVVTSIVIDNQWKYTKDSGSETETSKYVLKVGEEITLPNNFASFKFLGFQSKASTEVQLGAVAGIENGGIAYNDLKGTAISIPLYKQFDLDYNVPRATTIAGVTYTFWLDEIGDYNTAADGQNDYGLHYIKGDYSTATNHTAVVWTDVNGFLYNSADSNTIGNQLVVSLDLGVKTATSAVDTTDYVLVADAGDEIAALVLDGGQTFNIFNKAKSATAPKLVFDDTNTDGASGVTYYAPNTNDFMTTLMNSTLGTYASTTYMAAGFTYTDNNVATTVDLQLRTGDSAQVWDYDAIRNESSATVYGPAKDATYTHWTSAIVGGADYFEEGYTEDGTLVSSADGVFTLTVPEEARLVEAYLGSTDMSSTTIGGETLTGLANGGSATTLGGTEITVNVNGSMGGVEVVPAGSLVKVAGAFSGGKSIIVGGFVVNTAAVNLQVSEGNTLEDMLVASGDYVAAVLSSGDIVAAGYNGADTGVAAGALITALEGLM